LEGLQDMSQSDKAPEIWFLCIFGHAQSIGNSLDRKQFGDFKYFPCKKKSGCQLAKFQLELEAFD
jgi:hypothetical protein